MNKGDYMVHWSGKVCMVEDMAEMNLTGTKRMYFILTPVRDKAEKIYVPIEKTEGTLRPVLSRKEAVSLAGRIRDIEPLQIKDEKQRAQEYKTAYYSQDYLNLVRIAKELYQRKESRGREGKKLPSLGFGQRIIPVWMLRPCPCHAKKPFFIISLLMSSRISVYGK